MLDYKNLIGTKETPLNLKTAPGTSDYTMHVDIKDGLDILVCTVGKTILHYDLRGIDDLVAMLKAHDDWIPLGSKDEKQEPEEGTVEHWARSSNNPIGGWYGLKKNFRGRFAMYVPPLMEHLGLVELEHNARDNRMRAKPS
ncbi:MAG: hypothetical protein KIH69_016105 [Anaerolineae bacterium]|nr:hypothetical protein [Anaerolineae bacterium]